MNQQLARRILMVMTLVLTVLAYQPVSARQLPPPTKSAPVIKPTATVGPEPVVYPDCSMVPLKAIGEAPLTVKFYASGGSSYSWWTADISTSNTGAGETWEHKFLNEGEYKVRTTCYSTDGNYNHATTWVTVLAPTFSSSTPMVPSPVVTPIAPSGSSLNIEQNSSQDGCNETAIKQSDQNSGNVFVFCGDMNGVLNITISTPTPPTEPEEPAPTSWWQDLGQILISALKALFNLN